MNVFNNKRILIAGKGISGEGAYKALNSSGAVCAFFDDVNPYEFNADIIVVSPGIDKSKPPFEFSRKTGVELIGEIEVGYLLNDKPIIAVTGTNGKTTTVKLIGEILKAEGLNACVCGNVGKAFSLSAFNGGYDYAVTEVSSFQLETVCKFRPHIACITNFSADHLNRYKNIAEYAGAKRRIALNQTAEDYLILSQDDIPLFALENFYPASKVLYTSVRGAINGAYVLGSYVYFCGERVCEVDRIKAEGEHNVKNVLTAVCACKLLGVCNSSIVKAVSCFEPDMHRLKLVAVKNGKRYYNDSKGTNVSASLCAARCMCGDTCIILGGSDKGYGYEDFFKYMPQSIVRVAAVGETAAKIKKAAYSCGFYNVREFSDFKEAFDWAQRGDEENVLLSPASASFDMFSSYSERGEYFERLVQDAE